MAGKKKTEPDPIQETPVAEPTPPPKKAGRPKGSVNQPKVPVRVSGGTRIDVPLSDIDLADETFKFRVVMRIGDIVESIKQQGQQFPVLLRPHPNATAYKYQLISGFRRVTAIKKLRGDTVNAIVRDDLVDNEQAFRVSVIENEIRKTYNDMDRAYAMLAYRKMGKRAAEIEELFQVGSRQRQRIEELTTFPEILQQAIADGRVSSTNAVRLMQHVRKYRDTDVEHWIDWITQNKATYEQLGKELKEKVAAGAAQKPVSFFVEETKEDGAKSLRIRPVSIGPSLSADQRRALVDDLKRVLQFIDGLG